MIAVSLQEPKKPHPEVQGRVIAAGVALGAVSEASGLNGKIHQLGEKMFEPLFIRGGTPTQLGSYFTEPQLNAILSVTGSLPGLILNTMAITGGIKMRHKRPGLGAALVGFGAANHLCSCIQPWTAAVKSASDIEKAALSGHEFSNLAVQMSNLTGMPLKTAAITNAVAWTVMIPAYLLLWAIGNKCTENNIVSDFAALKLWLHKTQTDPKTQAQFIELKKAYKGKFKNEHDLNLFAIYLIEKIPSSQKDELKSEIIREAKESRHCTRTEKIINNIALGSILAYVAARVVYLATEIFFPVASWVTKGLTYSCPVLAAVSVISDLYATAQDLKNKALPKKIKMLSVAKLVCNVASTVIFIALLLVPGVNVIALALYTASVVAMIAFAWARNNALQRHVEIQQAIEPQNFKFMCSWSKKQRKNSAAYPSLVRWQNRIEEAKQENLLTKKQIKMLKQKKV